MITLSKYLIPVLLLLSVTATATEMNFDAAEAFTLDSCDTVYFLDGDGPELNMTTVREWSVEFYSVLFNKRFDTFEEVGGYLESQYSSEELRLISFMSVRMSHMCSALQYFENMKDVFKE